MNFKLVKDGKSPSSETLLPVDAREKTATRAQPTTADNRQRPDSTSKMATIRTGTIIMLVCMLALLGVASARMPCHGRVTNHEALEVVRRSDAPLGRSILQLAKRDDNSTSGGPSTTPPDSETETETESETPTSSTPTEIPPSTTIIPPPSTSTSDEPPSSSSSSSSVRPPTSNTPSSTPRPTPSSSLPGTSLSTSDSTSSQTSSSEPESSSSSAPQTRPSSSIPGETTLTTSTKPPSTTNSPRPTSRQTTETFTSTSPNGAVVVITRTNFVPADGVETPAPTQTGAPPSLQNSAVHHRGRGSTVAGIVGFAMLLLVV